MAGPWDGAGKEEAKGVRAPNPAWGSAGALRGERQITASPEGGLEFSKVTERSCCPQSVRSQSSQPPLHSPSPSPDPPLQHHSEALLAHLLSPLAFPLLEILLPLCPPPFYPVRFKSDPLCTVHNHHPSAFADSFYSYLANFYRMLPCVRY